jgi:hypothetical protein
MDAHTKPSKEQVREWLHQVLESREPPPAPQEIAEQLWHFAERDRQRTLS